MQSIIANKAYDAIFEKAKLVNRPDNPEPTITDLIEKIVEIRLGLIDTLKNLRSNLQVLESQSPTVLFEVEEYKRTAESKAINLESEVNRLREELRSIKDLLGPDEESA